MKPLIVRVFAFLLLFIIVSGITGPWIIGTKLLYGFHFFIYGNLGKMVLISAIIFYLLTRNRLNNHQLTINNLTIKQFNHSNVFFIAASAALLPVFFFLANLLLKEPAFNSNLPLSFLTHAVLITIPALLIPGIFGWRFVRKFAAKFKKEIAVCLGLSIVFDLTIFQVWKLWPYFSRVVLAMVAWLFSLTFPTYVTPPYTLTVRNFSVSIAQACSGVDSLFLFSSLYIFFGILDWKVFDRTKLLAMFVPAAIGLFLVNVLRVYLLVLVGVLISPELTLKLFHTYIGMVLFIVYFLLFWKLTYGWMRKKK